MCTYVCGACCLIIYLGLSQNKLDSLPPTLNNRCTVGEHVPKLHLNQAELLEVCTQLKGPEYGIFLSQHDQRGASKAPVDVQAEPDTG